MHSPSNTFGVSGSGSCSSSRPHQRTPAGCEDALGAVASNNSRAALPSEGPFAQAAVKQRSSPVVVGALHSSASSAGPKSAWGVDIQRCKVTTTNPSPGAASTSMSRDRILKNRSLF